MWEDIKSFEDEGYLMNLSTPGEDRWSEQGYVEEGDASGLLPGHAYTVIQVREIKNYKLVNLRNPWGNFE
jgi:calpain-15